MKAAGKAVMSVACILGFPLALGIISLMISPPWAGNRIAAERGLKRPLVIAHRGASYYAPELTIPSFALARDIGADYVETDVQRTRDGVLINFHDNDLSRTTNVAEVFPGREKDPVSSFTWDELARLDAGTWFNRMNPARAKKDFAGLKIPSFNEYLTVLSSGRNRPGLFIELKNPGKYPGIEGQIVSALRAGGWLSEKNRRRVILQSFDEKSLAILKKTAPAVMRNLLVNEDEEKKKGSFAALLETARVLESEIGPSGYLAYPWNIGRAHRMDKLVFVYTIDKTWHFMLFTFFGVDGMITNRCDIYLDYIGNRVFEKPSRLVSRYE